MMGMYQVDRSMLNLLHRQLTSNISESADEQGAFLIAQGLLLKIVELAKLGDALSQVMSVVEEKSMALVIECCGTAHIAEYGEDPDTYDTSYSHCVTAYSGDRGVSAETLLQLISRGKSLGEESLYQASESRVE